MHFDIIPQLVKNRLDTTFTFTLSQSRKIKNGRLNNDYEPVIYSIQHMKGWEIWPLIGNERETKDRIEPDRTDQNLTGIFVENGDWAMYQYGLEPGK